MARALLILMLAANTAFADFPRLGALLAADGHLPRLMAFRGDRLVFQNGIPLLILLAGVIIVFCKTDGDRLMGSSPSLAFQLHESPYGSFLDPLVAMIRQLQQQEPDQRLTVMMPEIVTVGVDGLLLNQSVDVVARALRESGSRLFSRHRYCIPV